MYISVGADPAWTDYDGSSALHWAASDGLVNIARLLLDHGWDLEARSSAGRRLVLQKVPSEANPKVRNHGEGPY